MKHRSELKIIVLIVIFAGILGNCNKNNEWTPVKPVLSSFAKKLIECGLYYSDDSIGSRKSCDCDSILKIGQDRIFRIAEAYIPYILSQPPNNALRSILNHNRSFADCIEEPYVTFHPDSLIGMGILLYFYNSERADQVIRDFFSKDSNALSIFFSSSTHIDRYAWIYNRPDPVKWARMLDSLNDHPERWKNIHKLYRKRYLKNTKYNQADSLQNPFKTSSYSEVRNSGDNRWVNSMKHIENKMNDTIGYKDSILLHDYQTIALIQTGLDYPRNWSERASDCHCDSFPEYEGCKLFCSAVNSLSRVTRQTGNWNLEKILSDMSSFALPNGGEENRGQISRFIGTGVLLYFFDEEKDDQYIRKHICNDTNIRRLFFAKTGSVGRFAWMSNRKNKMVWASFVDSLNTELAKENKVDSLLYNPFQEFMTYATSYREDSISQYNCMHALELEMDRR